MVCGNFPPGTTEGRNAMAEYLSTREVANYLHLNEKKVYALVAEGKMPASRVCGKWLFPRHLIDQWVDHNTQLPPAARMEALLDDLLIVQGSDDMLLDGVFDAYRECEGRPVVSARVGSMAGLDALEADVAHAAGCHVEPSALGRSSARGRYLVSLFRRAQGLMFHPDRPLPGKDISVLGRQGIRLADRQPHSGTFRLTRRLLAQAGVDPATVTSVGPYVSHLEVALAVHTGVADVAVGSQAAASRFGLAFIHLEEETFRLALPTHLASHPRMARFLDFTLDRLNKHSTGATEGYQFDISGQLEVCGPQAPETLPQLRSTPA